MHLIELYKSVQGESSFSGLPCIFVRLAGCNLRCAWCDSEYTFTGGKNKSAIHWDIVKDLRQGGLLYADGKLVQENGAWLL